jgi:hypothetical protein
VAENKFRKELVEALVTATEILEAGGGHFTRHRLLGLVERLRRGELVDEHVCSDCDGEADRKADLTRAVEGKMDAFEAAGTEWLPVVKLRHERDEARARVQQLEKELKESEAKTLEWHSAWMYLQDALNRAGIVAVDLAGRRVLEENLRRLRAVAHRDHKPSTVSRCTQCGDYIEQGDRCGLCTGAQPEATQDGPRCPDCNCYQFRHTYNHCLNCHRRCSRWADEPMPTFKADGRCAR